MQKCCRRKFCTSSTSLVTKYIPTLQQHTMSKHHTIFMSIWGSYKKINKRNVSLPLFPMLHIMSLSKTKQGSALLHELTEGQIGRGITVSCGTQKMDLNAKNIVPHIRCCDFFEPRAERGPFIHMGGLRMKHDQFLLVLLSEG